MGNDLISRSALLTEYDKQHKGAPGRARKLIVEAPAVDAVPVVRCKDCKWYREESEACGFWPDEGYRDPEHFCGEGRSKCQEKKP